MDVIRVALTNDYEVVVRGLAEMMRSYRDRIQVVELDLRTSIGEPVDIALYDSFANPQPDSAGLQKLATNPMASKFVVYTWNLDESVITAALANGAAGYVAKNLPARQLVAALEDIHAGRQRVHLGTGGPKVTGGDWPGREEGLTQRESEVLALITQGFSNTQIAEHAGLSINSVKTYIRSCYRRIGVTRRSQAVLWGVQHGFLPDEGRIIPENDQKS